PQQRLGQLATELSSLTRCPGRARVEQRIPLGVDDQAANDDTIFALECRVAGHRHLTAALEALQKPALGRSDDRRRPMLERCEELDDLGVGAARLDRQDALTRGRTK